MMISIEQLIILSLVLAAMFIWNMNLSSRLRKEELYSAKLAKLTATGLESHRKAISFLMEENEKRS